MDEIDYDKDEDRRSGKVTDGYVCMAFQEDGIAMFINTERPRELDRCECWEEKHA